MPAGSLHSFRDVGGPFSQIWDLLGLLPRRKSTADRLTECFLEQLNWAIDAVHPTAFRAQYQAFWARKFGFDDLATIDLRWLALLFIVLAYGVLLDCPQPLNVDMQRELEETSLRFYWAARRAIVIAPTFYGESTDLVRAGVLVTRYLIYSRRVPESWLTTSFAMRMAQAQGMHIDGERWRLSRKDTETRRRLWSNLYLLDKTIALSLGRPFAIVDQQCLVEKANNVWLDDMDDDTAASAPVLPISEPTPSLSNRLCHGLAIIIGAIQEKCFGLFTVSYDTVLALDREILEWRNKLPPYFRLEDPDLSLDSHLPYLAWHRLHLHSMYHFARVTLHRPYLLRPSITNRFRTSHDACIASACADLSMRLQSLSQPLQDRLRWTLGPHYLFNSALVLGIIAVRDPFSHRSLAILEDLAAYCAMQRRDIWVNEFALAEVKIVELCIKKARELRGGSEVGVPNVSSVSRPNADVHTPSSLNDAHIPMADGPAGFGQASAMDCPGLGESASWQPLPWDDSFTFPEASDLQSWEQVIDSITQNPDRIL
ncbi:putative nuclear protein [Botryosphaeria dothidea]|uniref:Nuclear protein n=1 Tax=Botryosphaeria dothidea TaxID=55169 RepID=A0A8H4ILD6_9PEZI|nr:putative nuclear protein [Botryosphaeria dothidea]